MPIGGATLPLHIKGFRDAFINASEDQPNYWKFIVGNEMTTDAIMEKFILMGDLIPTQPVEDVGGVPLDAVQTFASKEFYTHQYSLGVQLTDKQLRTDQSGLLKAVPKLLGQSDYLAKEQLVADLINNGTDSNYTGIDGVALFSDSHPIANGGTFDNLSTAASLSYSALEQMLTDLRGHKTYKGNPWLTWGGYRLVTGKELALLAKRILVTSGISGSADVDKNVAADDIMATPGNQFLADTNGYTLIPADVARNPLFLLTGLNAEVREDPKPSEWRTIYVVGSDRTAGWLSAQGVQHNAGA